MCDNTIVLFVSWSNEQLHAWILIAYFHVNVNLRSLAAFCQQINIFPHLWQSKGNDLYCPVNNDIKIGSSQSQIRFLLYIFCFGSKFIEASYWTETSTYFFKTLLQLCRSFNMSFNTYALNYLHPYVIILPQVLIHSNQITVKKQRLSNVLVRQLRIGFARPPSDACCTKHWTQVVGTQEGSPT